MKKIILIFLAFISAVSAQLNGPKISFNEVFFDFKDVIEGENVSYDFIVTNTGNEKLIIQSVKASCGCTAVKPEKNELAPNETTKIKVIYSTRGRVGKTEKYVYVKSNDPENSEIRLKFAANVIEKEITGAIIFLNRKLFSVNEVAEGQKLNYEVVVTNRGKKILNISKINPTTDKITVKIDKQTIQPGESALLKIKFNTKGRSGLVTERIKIFSDAENSEEETITITGEIVKRKN